MLPIVIQILNAYFFDFLLRDPPILIFVHPINNITNNESQKLVWNESIAST